MEDVLHAASRNIQRKCAILWMIGTGQVIETVSVSILWRNNMMVNSIDTKAQPMEL